MAAIVRRLLTAFLLVIVGGLSPAPAQITGPVPRPQADGLLSSEQLEQLVAPIALHPDTLVAEMLMASTYPLEVVEAARWSDKNKSLKGEQLKAAADKQTWDDSVKTLTATPDVLASMSEHLDWTQKLGNAVLAQQADVMDAIQRLRSKAQANNKLTSTKEQTVSVAPAASSDAQTSGNVQPIVIEPTQPDTIYVPYYDPAVVYGDWPYSDYPPYYFTPPGYIGGAAIATGIAFAAGVAVGAWAINNNYWGGSINWRGNGINVNRPVHHAASNNWTHNPDHRHGVRYNNASVAQRFGQSDRHKGAQARLDYRGHSGERVLNPDRPNAGADRPDRGDRPDGANRPDRPDGARDGAKDKARDAARSDSNRGAKSAKPGNAKAGNAKAGNAAKSAKSAGRPQQNRPAAKAPAHRDNAFSHVQPARAASAHGNRGRTSYASHGGGARTVGMGGGGGGHRGGGGGGRRR
jgi:hypothetical protein